MSATLLLEKSGAVATITFNRPEKANAMDIGWLAPITDFLRDVEHDPAIRCVLMHGNGKHFMAGGDLEIVQAFVSQPPERRAAMAEQPIHEYNVMARVMRRLGKPIVASVQGGVAGAAVGLVAACDLVVAADNTLLLRRARAARRQQRRADDVLSAAPDRCAQDARARPAG